MYQPPKPFREFEAWFPQARRALFLVLLPAALASNGCNRITRTKQCRALIARMDPELDAIDALIQPEVATERGTLGDGTARPFVKLGGTPASTAGSSARLAGVSTGGSGASGTGANGESKRGTTSSDYVAAAVHYERLAKQLGPMGFASEDMARAVAEYAGILNASAQSLRALAAALDANNGADFEKSSRDLDRLAPRERSVVGRMNGWCQPGN